jgi:hypothetical protein
MPEISYIWGEGLSKDPPRPGEHDLKKRKTHVCIQTMAFVVMHLKILKKNIFSN